LIPDLVAQLGEGADHAVMAILVSRACGDVLQSDRNPTHSVPLL
jgi:hypothetical protein